MYPLYPEIKPNTTTLLDVSDGHQLYVEECGNQEGLPVLILHGGPGLGCNADSRRYFDPAKYRIILFDQRGSGRSRPHASIDNNTTQHLIADIEAIRQHFNIEQWVLAGGSWGSTLALVYAETYPERVLGMILRGVFLARKQDIDWLYHYGTSQIFPDYWQEFAQSVSRFDNETLIDAYYRRLNGDDELARMAAAKAWCAYEGRVATLEPNHNVVEALTKPHLALAMARISCHYFKHDCFLKPNQILEQADRLKDIPGFIVHGRYDLICPLENAWTLQEAWNNCEIHVIRDAGHAASEAGIIDALIRAGKALHQELTHDCTDPTGN